VEANAESTKAIVVPAVATRRATHRTADAITIVRCVTRQLRPLRTHLATLDAASVSGLIRELISGGDDDDLCWLCAEDTSDIRLYGGKLYPARRAGKTD